MPFTIHDYNNEYSVIFYLRENCIVEILQFLHFYVSCNKTFLNYVTFFLRFLIFPFVLRKKS